ncbi:MAG: CRISPR-associated endonuclease Cas2 [Thiothrix sp.]|nr:CRISPR-associated endonuclease Cas2 [Thiothrix sp.]HPE60793.1 CRISPR-associated endonuclease Cas2 [Thiolinea sp.]
MANPVRPHLVCYDIRCPKRLARVHRFLKKRAVPLQYSVFLVRLNREQRGWLLQQLERLIDARADDVRVYPLPQKPDWCALGKPLWEEGMLLDGVELPPVQR